MNNTHQKENTDISGIKVNRVDTVEKNSSLNDAEMKMSLSEYRAQKFIGNENFKLKKLRKKQQKVNKLAKEILGNES